MEVGVFYLTPPIRFSNIIHLISKIPVLLQKKKRFDMIKYNPKFSIKKNAEINGCTESAIRKFIHKNSIDRRFVWQKEFNGNPTIKWIHNEQKQ